ncbi:sigma factor-like helix-turn-helix DNA-binding protein [Nannocystis pusilla]|uniref:sigma factor-like helix-turn-helix DNA-binding protein n=1 Tax=Nannocystis pusilla TaxID=889268 RepID=UPI003DA3B85E
MRCAGSPCSPRSPSSLYYWEGLTSAEIAEVLEIPLGTAQTRLRRARELLVKAIEERRREAGMTIDLPPDLDAWAASLRDLARG